jgi:hypothetical protein
VQGIRDKRERRNEKCTKISEGIKHNRLLFEITIGDFSGMAPLRRIKCGFWVLFRNCM